MSGAPWRLSLAIVVALIVGYLSGLPTALVADPILPVRVTLTDVNIRDQDDMCFWVHPHLRSLSTIITSDKDADKLFVYDLLGHLIQTIPIQGQPGNIDIRYNFDLGGRQVDIVAFNDRSDSTMQVFEVDPVTRFLSRVDNDSINTGPNYGLCMYRSPNSGSVYAFTTAENGGIRQFELRDDGGFVGATLVRSWDIGRITEGCVCDDETGFAYFGEEDVGIWKIGAEPSDNPTERTEVAAVGDSSGLTADVEGLAIYYSAGHGGYLIASSQGSSNFKVYERTPPHRLVETFSVTGVTSTDGIDVINLDLGPLFPTGIIAAHNAGPAHKTVEICGFEDSNLPVDTSYWNPRDRNASTATQISLGSVQAEPERVRLTWFGARAVGVVATVYRREGTSAWAALADVTVDGTGRLVFEDRGVEPGRRYGYRLGIRHDDGEELLGEAWVDVPTGYSLALQGARPNPVESDLLVSFSLPDGQAASLGVYDVAGRRLWSRRVDTLGPGSHVVRVDEPAGLGAGVYVLRLTHGSRSLTRRIVVAR